MSEARKTERETAITEELLAARYGRRRPLTPTFWWSFATAAIAVGIAVLAIIVVRLPSSNIEYRTLDYDIVTDHETVVTLQVSMAPGQSARCAIEALDANYTPIGWHYVDLAADTARTRSLTVTVATLERPVAASVNQCWLS